MAPGNCCHSWNVSGPDKLRWQRFKFYDADGFIFQPRKRRDDQFGSEPEIDMDLGFREFLHRIHIKHFRGHIQRHPEHQRYSKCGADPRWPIPGWNKTERRCIYLSSSSF